MAVSTKHAHAYGAYLNGPVWGEKRKEALRAAQFKCQACGGNENLEVHHLTYERMGFERPTDLQVLCNSCHALEHGRAPKGSPVVSVDEAFWRAMRREIERERLEGEQAEILRAAMGHS